MIACGEAVTTWRAGDRVFGLVGGGGLADMVAVHERHVARIPDDLTDREAAAVPRRSSPPMTPSSPGLGSRSARRFS